MFVYVTMMHHSMYDEGFDSLPEIIARAACDRMYNFAYPLEIIGELANVVMDEDELSDAVDKYLETHNV